MAFELVIEDGTGKPDANSYTTIATADSYFESRPRTDAWVNLDDEQKAILLVHATRVLDHSIVWWGEKLTETQALQFPRTVVSGVPLSVKYAVCELALELNGRDVTAQPGTTGIASIKVGPIQIEADSIRPEPIISRFVVDMISAYGSPRSSNSSVQLFRR